MMSMADDLGIAPRNAFASYRLATGCFTAWLIIHVETSHVEVAGEAVARLTP